MIDGVGRRVVRILACAVVLAGAASLYQAAAPAPTAAVQSDLSYTSNSTWTADPVAARVHVQAYVTVTSDTVDSPDRQYFYDRIQLTLPASSTGYTARSAVGNPLPLTVESVNDSGVTVYVYLGQRLYSGQTTSFGLYFDLVDKGGSTDRDLRIGYNLMSFPVSAFGSPGTPGSSVTVVFPAGFTVQEEFGGLTRSVFGSGEVVFSSGPLDNSADLNAWFTAVQPVPASDFRTRAVTIGPLRVTLRYWVDDPGWADQVERVMRAGYPVLAQMIGLGDPIKTTVTVEEASTQETVGFSGAYDQDTGGIQVSYFADPFVILHEVAHMWFNDDLVSERWIQEGFASYYADQAVAALGYTNHAPVLTDRLMGSAVPLNDWSLAGEPNSVTDAYLYAATLDVARQIAAEAGQDGLRKIWQAARAGQAAYQPARGAPDEILARRAPDWRRFLDLLEQTTGRSFEVIWQKWVTNASQVSLLQQRATVLSEYSSVERAASTWNLPAEIRRALDDWQFGEASSLISQARGILADRDQIAVEAVTQGTTPPPGLRIAFEESGIAAASSEAAQELAVLGDISSADQARTANGGAARDLGLIGADPQADLTAARRAFAAGDLSGAAQLAVRARNAWQSANSAGQIRIAGSLSLLLGGLLLVGLFVWTRGSRLRVAAAEAGAGASGEARTAAAGGPRGAAGGELRGAVRGARAARAAPASRAGSGTVVAAAEASPPGEPEGSTGEAIAGGAVPADDPPDVDWSDASSESAYELLQRGHALLRDHHNAQAAVVLERAERLEPSKGSILEALGRAYFNSGQHQRAAETFEALLEVDPSAHYGHFALGLSLARLGRPQEARTHLRLAAALNPASETYRRALDRMEATIG